MIHGVVCLNAGKSTTVVVSRTRSINPPQPYLIINGHSLAMGDSFKLLGMLFDNFFPS